MIDIVEYDLTELAPAGLRRFTRAEYDRLIEDGFFANDEAYELIHGLLVCKMPIGDRHKETADALTEMLVLALHRVARVSAGGPLAANDDSEPEPDFTVMRSRHLPGKPDGEQVALVIEVANTSLRYDRNIKAPLYAAAGVPEYWIVNLVDDAIEIHTDPRDGEYQTQVTAGPGETIAPQAYPDAAFAVDAILRPGSK